MATRHESSSPVCFSVDASSGSIHDGYSKPIIQHGRRSEETAGYRSTTSMPIEVQQPVSNNMHGTETEVSDILTRRGTVPDDPPPPYRPTDLSHLQAVNMTSVEGPPPPYMYGGLPRQEITSQFTPQLPRRRQVPLPSAPPLDVIMDDKDTEDAAMLPMTAQEDGVTTNAPLPPSHGHMTLFQNASEDIVLSQDLALDRECELSLYTCLCRKDFSTTEPLRIASKTGWTEIRHTMFPLLSTYGREALVCTQLATFLLLLAFAITCRMFADSQWTIECGWMNVALTGTGTLIATINMAITTCMQRCLLVRRLLCCRRNDVQRVLASGQCLPGMFIVFFDLSLILVSEILLFPIFICFMFRFLVAFSNANNYLDPSGDFDVKVVVANAAAVLVCLIAAVLVFTLNLHKKAVYRLALYQVMAACALGVVELLQIVMSGVDGCYIPVYDDNSTRRLVAAVERVEDVPSKGICLRALKTFIYCNPEQEVLDCLSASTYIQPIQHHQNMTLETKKTQGTQAILTDAAKFIFVCEIHLLADFTGPGV
ncbi:hypothetical protein EMCRGX_G004435 [Ephydatia muelleri]